MASLESDIWRPFEEGERVGGAIVYTETQRTVRKGKAFMIVMPVVVAALFAGILLTGGFRINTSTLTLIGVAALSVGLLVLEARRTWRTATPFRIYENGVSLGAGRLPFTPFDSAYCLEEREVTGVKGLKRLVLTWVDGNSLDLCAKPVGEFYDLGPNYGPVRDFLFRRVDPRFRPRRAWSAGAIAFMDAIPAFTGPSRVQIEWLAQEVGATTIDEAFLEGNWQRVREGRGVGAFRRVAKDSYGTAKPRA